MQPKLKVWILFGRRTKFGAGRAQLLTLIDELGSLKKAVDRMGMSYRNAWGYLRELEQAAGFKLLKRQPGPRGGARLTKRGRVLLEQSRQFERRSQEAVTRAFKKSFEKT